MLYFICIEIFIDFLDTTNYKNILEIRKTIFEANKIKETFKNVAESDLRLWRVSNITNDTNRMNILHDTSRTIDVAKELDGKELYPIDEIPGEFKNPTSNVILVVTIRRDTLYMYRKMADNNVLFGKNILFDESPQKPTTKEQLIKCLCCILIFLKGYHKMGFMHRDIRWGTIRKLGIKDEWMIVNYDYVSESPAKSPDNNLDQTNHAPEIFNTNGTHDKSVDIWSVGNLIKTASVKPVELDQQLIDFSCELMETDPTKRPTAKQAYNWLWNKYEGYLRSFNFLKED